MKKLKGKEENSEQKDEKGEEASSESMEELFRQESSRRTQEVGESSNEEEDESLRKNEASSKKKKLNFFSRLRIGSSSRTQELVESLKQKDGQEENANPKEVSSNKKTNFLGRFKRRTSKQNQKEISESKEVPEDCYDLFRNFLSQNSISYPEDELIPDSSIVSWEDIIKGTQHRSPRSLLTRGVYGKCYRCNIRSSCHSVAVKFHFNVSAHQEFMRAEVKTLMKANHKNVVKLLGISLGEEDEVALVYNFMPIGTLDQHLLGLQPGKGFGVEIKVLNWEMRMNIAHRLAEALAYLHTKLQVIHRDVKIEDVLLDHELNPILTNFELAVGMVIGEDGNEVERVISPHKGTPGCLSPETELNDTISSKCDVYGYGVLLFQLFTGMKAQDVARTPANITDLMMRFWTGEKSRPQVIDAKLSKRYSVQGLDSVIEVAKMCTNPQASLRPNMGTVVKMVDSAADEDVEEFPELTEAIVLRYDIH